MSTAVVIGGGISGLASCYYLQKSAHFSKIILVEASNRFGGWMHTVQSKEGACFELGPRSIRPVGEAGKNTLRLIEELGLSFDVIGVPRSHPASKNRFIYKGGHVHALPNNLTSLFLTTPPFSKPLLLYAQKEMFLQKQENEDESVYDFICRRFGPDLAENAIDPMCRGIFAGDCRKLSIKSCLPQVYDLEQNHGSVVKGILQTMIKNRRAPPENHRLIAKAKEEKWSTYSFANGIQQLPDQIVAHVTQNPSVELLKNTPCSGLDFKNGKVSVKINGDMVKADHVVSSIFAQDIAKLLPKNLGVLSGELSKIPAVNTVVACIEIEDYAPLPVPGFGHLLPSREDGKTLGVIYDTETFPELDRKDKPSSRFTVMLGGSWYSELEKSVPSMSKEDLGQLAKDLLYSQLKIENKPSKILVEILPNCIPQYLLGHSKILENISLEIKSKDVPLSLVGSSYKGPSLNDCINNARIEIERVTGVPSSFYYNK